MATFTVTTTGQVNQRPDVLGDLTFKVDNGSTTVFTLDNFTVDTTPPYNDPEGDALAKIIIDAESKIGGELKLSGNPVLAGDEITAAQISAGELAWVDDGTNTNSHTASFEFRASDEGSLIFSTVSGVFTIAVGAAINAAPLTVGDRTENINYGEMLVFNRDMFTTLTTPAYSDEEGDPAVRLQILSLPIQGKLKLNGVDVILNQIINFSEIDSGNLTYSSSLSVKSDTSSSFDFAISDSLTGLFTQ